MGNLNDFRKWKYGGWQPGKINASLDEMLQNVEWGEFKLGDLFDIVTSKRKFDANKVKVVQDSGFPYIVRTSVNNGQKGLIKVDTCYLNEGNTIAFGQDTATVFYRR